MSGVVTEASEPESKLPLLLLYRNVALAIQMYPDKLMCPHSSGELPRLYTAGMLYIFIQILIALLLLGRVKSYIAMNAWLPKLTFLIHM